MWIFTAALFVFFALELLYFKIANHFNIIDKPNQRSSHTQITLRGGGIIFPIALIIGILIWQPSLWLIGLGVFLIAIISFIDDILTLNNKLRITFHIICVLLLLYQVYIINIDTKSLFLSPYSFLFIPIAMIVIIGVINAYNFMDGINGITVLYSLVGVAGIWCVQGLKGIYLLDNSIWLLILASLLVFGFFNLRKRAKSFAGDIGSISMALILCFLILSLITATGNMKWLLFLGIYGLDAVGTITCRMIRRENIFEAHRSHFYQYLANEKKWAHVWVSSIYALFQLLINAILILTDDIVLVISTYLVIVMLYILARLKLEGRQRLFENYLIA